MMVSAALQRGSPLVNQQIRYLSNPAFQTGQRFCELVMPIFASIPATRRAAYATVGTLNALALCGKLVRGNRKKMVVTIKDLIVCSGSAILLILKPKYQDSLYLGGTLFSLLDNPEPRQAGRDYWELLKISLSLVGVQRNIIPLRAIALIAQVAQNTRNAYHEERKPERLRDVLITIISLYQVLEFRGLIPSPDKSLKGFRWPDIHFPSYSNPSLAPEGNFPGYGGEEFPPHRSL